MEARTRVSTLFFRRSLAICLEEESWIGVWEGEDEDEGVGMVEVMVVLTCSELEGRCSWCKRP